MIQVDGIAAFEDNYIWVIRIDDSNDCVIVDPGDAQPVLRHMQQHGLTPTAILITHRHHDHVGGVAELLKHFKLPVYGPQSVSVCTQAVCEGDTITLLNGRLIFEILDIPGHTLEHIAYLSQGNLFSGDTIFSAGCGRVFDNSAIQLHESLTRLSNLPADTMIYCTHEYTAANIKFALEVEPDNDELHDYAKTVASRREQGESTIPTSLQQQLDINPFLRVDNQTIRASLQRYTDEPISSSAAAFIALRRWKDNF